MSEDDPDARDDAPQDDALHDDTHHDDALTPRERAALSDADAPLAVVVEQGRSQTAIAELRAEGVYDDGRRVRPYGPETVALPVAAPPETVDALDVVRQPDPDYRERGIEHLLRERGWDEDAVAAAPTSWAVIGSCVLVDLDSLPAEREAAFGEALLELHGEADTVLADEGIEGETRTPSVRTIAGTGDTETVHTEHGTQYGLDLAAVMFSPGNKRERARMGEVVREDERVFDMFAGIGYFTLPMARAGATVTAAEVNPTAYRYLIENAVMNGVEDRVSAFRADCREVEATADRVVMGYYGYAEDGERVDEAHEYLDTALDALVPGGVVHLHEATPSDLVYERPIDRIETAARERGRTVEVLETTTVKSHSAGVDHVVVDARID